MRSFQGKRGKATCIYMDMEILEDAKKLAAQKKLSLSELCVYALYKEIKESRGESYEPAVSARYRE